MNPLQLTETQLNILKIKEQAKMRRADRNKNFITRHPQAHMNKSFTCLQLNCNKNHHVLQFCVDHLAPFNQVDVLCISEPPYDRSNRSIHAIDSKGTPFYWQPQPGQDDKPYAAIVILNTGIKFDIDSIHLSKYHVSVKLQFNSRHITVHSCYMPVRSAPDRKDVMSIICQFMSRPESHPSLVVGDFNLHHSRWSITPRSWGLDTEEAQFMRTFDIFSWSLLNKKGIATRFDPSGRFSPSAIDLAFASASFDKSQLDWQRLEMIEGTDHFPCKITWNVPTPAPANKTLIRGLNWKLAIKANNSMLAGSAKNLEELYEILDTHRKDLKARAARYTLHNKLKILGDEKLTQLNRTRNTIRTLKKQQKKDPTNGKIKNRIAYLRKQIANLAFKAKKINLKHYIRNLDSKQLWRHLPIKKAKKKLIALKTSNGKLVNPKDILQVILSSSMVPTAQEPLMPKVNSNQVKDPDITTKEIDAAIKKIKTSTTAGQDLMTVNLLKRLYKLAPQIIQKAYINAYNTSIIPQQWRKTRLAIISKTRTSEARATDIRLIGIPTALTRGLHNIIKDRLLHWTISNEVLDPSQHGVIPGATIQSVFGSLNSWIDTVMSHNSHKAAIMSKLDIKKAFDYAQFNHLLQALIVNKFPDRLINLIREFFVDQEEIATLDGTSLSRVKTCGTIQGSPYSPLLFSILLAGPLKKLRKLACNIELKYKIIQINFLVYLDDLILWVQTKEPRHNSWSAHGAMIQGITAALVEHYQNSLKEVGLELAKDKLEHMPMPDTKHPFTILIDGQPINIVKRIKVLGVTYSPKYYAYNSLHVEEMASKAQMLINDLYNQGRFFNRTDLKTIAEATIIKKIMYAAGSWGQRTTVESMTKLDKALRACMLKCSASAPYSPTLTAMLSSNIIPAMIMVKKFMFQDQTKARGIYLDNCHLQILKKINPISIFHPADIPIPTSAGFFYSEEELPEVTSSALHLYTDASINQDGAGFAILEPASSKMLMFRVHNYTDSFTLELTAIHETIQQIQEFRKPQHESCIIFTDSQSAINAILNPLSQHEIIINIRKTLHKKNLLNFIQIAWVKAHGNILGNQIVDILASLAKHSGQTKEQKVPTSVLKRLTLNEIDKSMEQYFYSKRATHFKFFYPTWQLVKAFLKSPTPAYLRFVNSQEMYLRDFYCTMNHRGWRNLSQQAYDFLTPFCECDDKSIQDSKHLVFTCKIFQEERATLQASLNINNDKLHRYLHENLRDEPFYSLVHNISCIAEAKMEIFRTHVKHLHEQQQQQHNPIAEQADVTQTATTSQERAAL